MQRNATAALAIGVVLSASLAGCSSQSTVATETSTTSTASAPAAAASEEAMQTVAYADTSSSQTLDLYLPSGTAGPTPLVVLIHGGAFAMGDSTMEAQYARALVNQGFAVAAVNYRLSGEATYPAGAQDVKAAVRYLRAHAEEHNLDPDKFAAWGQSAGGYLASLLGATGDQQTIFDDPALGNAAESSAVQAVVSWFGPSNFATMDEQAAQTCGGGAQSHDAANSPESAWLGESVATSDQTASTDLTAYVESAQTLPAWYLAHGTADCNVPSGQSAELKTALDVAGATATYAELDGAGHMDPAFDATQVEPTVAFLKQTLGVE